MGYAICARQFGERANVLRFIVYSLATAMSLLIILHLVQFNHKSRVSNAIVTGRHEGVVCKRQKKSNLAH